MRPLLFDFFKSLETETWKIQNPITKATKTVEWKV